MAKALDGLETEVNIPIIVS